MVKISELNGITGQSTSTEDLFVIVNINQGSFGTKNITRKELVNSIEKETFDAIQITGGNIENVNFNYSNFLPENLADNDYFIVKNVSDNKTYKVTYAEIKNRISLKLPTTKKIYVSEDGKVNGDGSLLNPYATLQEAFNYANSVIPLPISITVNPGDYYTNGNLALPDYCSLTSTNGQYTTNIIMNAGYEEENCILVGSGSYVQGFSFSNLRIDDLDNPSKGFAIAFRPGATIVRSPYIRDISQISNYNRNSIAAPLDPVNSNPLVGNGGGVLLADRAVLNQNSIFTYMLAFGATPRSPNGIGYVAKNGAGINGISSISIFQRCAFYALNGGQITLNNSGTQFGDISMRAKGSTLVVEPYTTNATLLKAETLGNAILTQRLDIIDDMWAYLLDEGYSVNEEFTKRDAENWLISIAYDFLSGNQSGTRNFVAGFFDYKGDHVFDVTNTTLLNAFLDSFDRMRDYIVNNITISAPEIVMLDGLVDDITKDTIIDPKRISFGSLVESLGHQFNLAGAGVNKNALPLNFRRVGKPLPASSSILQEDGGRVRFSGADELNNQYFAKGLRVNGRTGRLEGRPFTSSVRKLARRAANSRAST
jgi:hypothetical protein